MKAMKKIGTIVVISMVGLAPAFSFGGAFHIEGKGSVNGMGINGEIHGEMNHEGHFYCPEVYRPVIMKVTFSDGYTETIRASNECFAHLEIRKLMEIHGRVVDKEVIESGIEQSPKPIGFKGEMRSETHNEMKERNREKYQNGFSGEIEFHGEIEIYSSMNPEKVKAELEKAGFNERTIDRILEVYNNPRYIVRTIFIATNGNITIKTSNIKVVEILKEEGFKVKLFGEIHVSMKSNDEREDKGLFREHNIGMSIEVSQEDIEKAQEEVQRMIKEKDRLIKEINKERIKIRQEIREVKRELVQKLKEKRRLSEEDREKVIQVIKDALRLKLEKLKLLIVMKQDSNSELIELLNVVEENGEVKEDNTLKYIAIINKLEKQLKYANNVSELKEVVYDYLKLKREIRMEMKGNMSVNNNSVKSESSTSVSTQ